MLRKTFRLPLAVALALTAAAVPAVGAAPPPEMGAAAPTPAPGAAAPAAPRQAVVLHDLDKNDLAALRRDFNAAAGNVRMLLILSPSCPGCQAGSRDVQAKLLEKIDFAQLRVFVVWFPLLDADSRAVAERSAAAFDDPRVTQYWAADWTLGNLYGKVLPFPKDYKYRVAVDVYLIFDEKQDWGAEVPRPVAFMHRLGTDERLFDADKLYAMLEGQIHAAVARGACSCNVPPSQPNAHP
jgi:hypothetical protein